MSDYARVFKDFRNIHSCSKFCFSCICVFQIECSQCDCLFSGNANKRLKEYQKIQKDYHKGTANKVLPKANHNDSTGTLTNADVGTDTATLTDVSGTATMTETDGEFANALYFAQSTTTLLDEN